MGAQEREVYTTTHKPKPIEECLQQIQEALEQIKEIREALEEKPNRSDLDDGLSDVAFKIEEGNEDLTRLQEEVAEVKDKVDDLYSEDR